MRGARRPTTKAKRAAHSRQTLLWPEATGRYCAGNQFKPVITAIAQRGPWYGKTNYLQVKKVTNKKRTLTISQAQKADSIAFNWAYSVYRICETKLDMIGRIRLIFGPIKMISFEVRRGS
jgi:hypothetical protein